MKSDTFTYLLLPFFDCVYQLCCFVSTIYVILSLLFMSLSYLILLHWFLHFFLMNVSLTLLCLIWIMYWCPYLLCGSQDLCLLIMGCCIFKVVFKNIFKSRHIKMLIERNNFLYHLEQDRSSHSIGRNRDGGGGGLWYLFRFIFTDCQ